MKHYDSGRVNPARRFMSGLLIGLLVAGVTFVGAVACGQRGGGYSKALGGNTAEAWSQQSASLAKTAKARGAAESSRVARTPVAIHSVAFYGWWWSEEQFKAGFDGDNPPAKEAYVRLDRWQATTPDAPHPDRIDITFRLKNQTDQPLTLTVEGSVDFKVASYEELALRVKSDEEFAERLKPVQWSDERKVGQLVVGTLQPGEEKKVRFRDFPLGSILDKYFEDDTDDLWAWQARITLVAKNPKGVEVASVRSILDLIPGD